VAYVRRLRLRNNARTLSQTVQAYGVGFVDYYADKAIDRMLMEYFNQQGLQVVSDV